MQKALDIFTGVPLLEAKYASKNTALAGQSAKGLSDTAITIETIGKQF